MVTPAYQQKSSVQDESSLLFVGDEGLGHELLSIFLHFAVISRHILIFTKLSNIYRDIPQEDNNALSSAGRVVPDS